jgi:hypothetical protein
MATSGLKGLRAYLPSSMLREVGGQLDVASRLQLLWQAHVPPPLAGHVRPTGYANGRLSVRVDASVWASRLRQQKQRVMQRLRRDPFLQQLQDIQVRVKPPGDVPRIAISKPRRTHRRLSQGAARLLHSLAKEVRDPALRAALERLGASAEAMMGREPISKKTRN